MRIITGKSSKNTGRHISEAIKPDDKNSYITGGDFFKIARVVQEKRTAEANIELCLYYKLVSNKERFYWQLSVYYDEGDDFIDGEKAKKSGVVSFRIHTQALRGKLFASIDKSRKFMIENSQGYALTFVSRQE